jgi:hypothetical protein
MTENIYYSDQSDKPHRHIKTNPNLQQPKKEKIVHTKKEEIPVSVILTFIDRI